MKLHKRLTINGDAFALVREDVRLDLHAPGRAAFTIDAPAPARGLVAFDFGYNDAPLERFFLGYIERASQANAREQVLFCRELTGTLAAPLPLNLRHVTAGQVLAEISRLTGLRFSLPDTPYSRRKAPFFYSLAAGFQALDSLGRVFSIPDYVWHQQGDGGVFVGSWADSYWGTREPLGLPVELLKHYQGNESAVIGAIPGLRPGAMLNPGQRLTSVTLAGTEMALRWTTRSNAL